VTSSKSRNTSSAAGLTPLSLAALIGLLAMDAGSLILSYCRFKKTYVLEIKNKVEQQFNYVFILVSPKIIPWAKQFRINLNST